MRKATTKNPQGSTACSVATTQAPLATPPLEQPQLQAAPSPAAVEQLFCLNIFIYLRPGNFCLFLASFYGLSLGRKCLL